MNIATKKKNEVNVGLIAELAKFSKEVKQLSFTNVSLNQYITGIVGRYMKPHEPVRTSFEYQLFLSIHRKTPTYGKFLTS